MFIIRAIVPITSLSLHRAIFRHKAVSAGQGSSSEHAQWTCIITFVCLSVPHTVI